jgi:hypothetical protein
MTNAEIHEYPRYPVGTEVRVTRSTYTDYPAGSIGEVTRANSSNYWVKLKKVAGDRFKWPASLVTEIPEESAIVLQFFVQQLARA